MKCFNESRLNIKVDYEILKIIMCWKARVTVYRDKFNEFRQDTAGEKGKNVPKDFTILHNRLITLRIAKNISKLKVF